MANAIVGSAILVGLAALIAIPVGLLTAIYVALNPNTPLGIGLRFGTDVLSGVPSRGRGHLRLHGAGSAHEAVLRAGRRCALAIIMLPTVVRTTEEMLKLVPGNLREASLSLGASEWKTSLQVVLPAAIRGW